MPAGSRPLVGSSRISRSGRLEQRGGDRQPLLHAERVALVALPLAAGQPDLRERRVDRACSGTPTRAGQQREVLAAGEGRARTWAARRPRRPGPSPAGSRRGTGSPNSRIWPAAGPGQAEQHPDRGGLARPVGAEEAVHAAGRARARSRSSTATTRRPRRVRNSLRRPVVSMTRSPSTGHSVESAAATAARRGHARGHAAGQRTGRDAARARPGSGLAA